MIYIASPYTHVSVDLMERRYEAVRAFTATLLENRVFCYSPIVHCHDLAKHHNLPKDFDFWQDYNRHMLDRSDKLIIFGLGGWKHSKGVEGEIAHWMQSHKPFLTWELTWELPSSQIETFIAENVGDIIEWCHS